VSGQHRGKFVAYYRVSTQRQGRSGLGLEARQRAVREHLDGGRWRIVAEITEIESGKRTDRPKLSETLRHPQRHKPFTTKVAAMGRKVVIAHANQRAADLERDTGGRSNVGTGNRCGVNRNFS